jgi:hypothetical protein
VWHGGGAYFVGFCFLFEVVQANVLPNVAAEVGKDGIDTDEAVEECCEVVVVFYLGGILGA